MMVSLGNSRYMFESNSGIPYLRVSNRKIDTSEWSAEVKKAVSDLILEAAKVEELQKSLEQAEREAEYYKEQDYCSVCLHCN